MNFLLSLQDFWTFDFLFYALGAALILSLLTGLMSPLVVAKRYAFIGESISHSTLLGLNLSLWLSTGDPLTLFFLTLLFTSILVMGLARSTHRTALPSDSLIGIFLTGTLALGVLIHFLFVKEKADMTSQLFGNILTVTSSDFTILIPIALIILSLFFFRYRSWLYFILDEEGARIHGIKTSFFHYIFFFLLTLLIVGTAKLAGTILINAFLLIPGIFAYRIMKSMKMVFAASVIFSLFSTLLGLALCNYLETPPGATLALVQFTLLIVAVGLHKLRKII
ncbi:MAG: metal ABC transporter permease [Bacteriovoracaceae bacterium]